MSARFEELDRRSTPMGEISLRRRLEPSLQVDVYEARLDDEYLMSSLFTTAEIELATLGLARVAGDALDVVVGGLGLGYTAHAVLQDRRVRSLHVIEALPDVIGWHRDALLPVSDALVSDPRCHLVEGDFFAMVAAGRLPSTPEGGYDAILVDIDHTPRHHLHPSHAPFYTAPGLRAVATNLRPNGVLALWSDDPPDPEFEDVVDEVFASSDAHVVTFPNAITGGESSNTVYVATRDSSP
jgi:spermidine synthase